MHQETNRFIQRHGTDYVHNIKTYLPLLGRVLLSAIFIVDGILQLIDPGGTARYFAKVHVPIPDFAVWVSVCIHVLGGLAILVGFQARWAATLLALFCLVCKIACNIDPLRGPFAPNTDPL